MRGGQPGFGRLVVVLVIIVSLVFNNSRALKYGSHKKNLLISTFSANENTFVVVESFFSTMLLVWSGCSSV